MRCIARLWKNGNNAMDSHVTGLVEDFSATVVSTVIVTPASLSPALWRKQGSELEPIACRFAPIHPRAL
jgi:hypothetical protein